MLFRANTITKKRSYGSTKEICMLNNVKKIRDPKSFHINLKNWNVTPPYALKKTVLIIKCAKHTLNMHSQYCETGGNILKCMYCVSYLKYKS